MFVLNGICVILLLSPNFYAFVPENIRYNKFQRFKEKSKFSLYYENEVTIDEANLVLDTRAEIDTTWWQIFGEDKKIKAGAMINEELKSSFSLPSVTFWRDIDFSGEDEDKSPPSLKEYFEGKILGPKHLENIQGLWMLMKNRGSLKHLNEDDIDRVMEALRVAYISLWGKITMRSLEVSINRARGTAAVLGELREDVNLVLSAILSDVMSELTSDKQREQLSVRFGEDVVNLSEKYNRLPVFMSRKAEYTDEKSENQIQMLLVSTSDDYRVLSIRLADRLHTLRTLRSLPLDDTERLKIAEEALKVYAPLAHRMGVMKVKGELEDLAFRHLHPEFFLSTKCTQIAANKAYHEAMDAVQQIMAHDPYLLDNKVSFKLSYRIKDKYQLFLKMQRKHLSSISQVRDALGMRIIITGYSRVAGEVEAAYIERGNSICYHLVEQIRIAKGWSPAIRGFKDYIKKPKLNGYESLHQYIKNAALGTNVEIQVRTQAMHVFSQLGEAAHWLYKDKIYQPKLVDSKIYRHAWRSPQQTAAKSPEELIDMAKTQLLASRVLVFLEDRSTVLNLMKGDTALDASFAVHSELGLSVSTVRIGGRKVPLDYTLKNGDVVTCESSPSVTAVPLWLDFVKSPNALAKIRRHFRENDRQVLICYGLVHLLMSLTKSQERVSLKWPKGIPNVAKLAEYIKMRTPSSITNFPEFLERLGGASCVSESASLIGSLLDIPMKDLTISPVGLGLIWVIMEDRNGFEDKEMQKNVLLPILKEVSTLGHADIQDVWVKLVGSRSLMLEDKPDTLLPLETLLSSTLGPSRKVYNFYHCVTKAPEHAMLPAPFSSISPQHSPRVKEREVWPGVSKSRSMSDREQGNKKYGLKTHSSLTITVKPAPSHVPYSVKDNSLNIGDISYTRRNLSRRSSSSAADYSHSRRN